MTADSSAKAQSPQSLRDILRALHAASDGDTVSVDEILDQIGHRSFAPAILVPAMILVSPISGIPGTPTIGAVIILLITVQAILGVDHLWLPAFVRKRRIKGEKLEKAVTWLERPVLWIDDHTERRVAFLARKPWSLVALMAIAALACVMPLLEVLPLVTSVLCFAISLLAIGMMGRDGLFMLSGYGFIILGASGLAWLIS
ncbi:Exopolysaccharide synthesis, ExoD [Aquimixticola soesokkakensis]|uniref:Exopolysaccharide synthesis, ExoD n=1 Tax=Aquimixticola soesokkakensis TaxID=1519096 RepID=A0A1Y5R803_9RHOB|nr:exopolysaccharide biosynthesis protein [Aquimixticola soesokkakensis]SLN10185.1 Exopolysaccharide synthesis, ExoD [Aquimixticola soesokkakensis]